MTLAPPLPIAEASEPDAAAYSRFLELRYRRETNFSRHVDRRITKVANGNPYDRREVYMLVDANGRERRFHSRTQAERFLRRELRGNLQFTPSMFGEGAT